VAPPEGDESASGLADLYNDIRIRGRHPEPLGAARDDNPCDVDRRIVGEATGRQDVTPGQRKYEAQEHNRDRRTWQGELQFDMLVTLGVARSAT
jgi:hypothetical protein